MKHPVCQLPDRGATRAECMGAALIVLGVGATVLSGAATRYVAEALAASRREPAVVTGGASTSVVLSTTSAFVAAGRDVFHVSPTELESSSAAMGVPMLTFDSTVRALALDDERLFAATESGHLCVCVLDESCQSAQPRCTESVLGARALSVDEDSVAVAASDGTIDVFVLDRDGGMTRTNRVQIAGVPTSIRLSNDRCVVGLHTPGDPVHRGAVSIAVVDEGGELAERHRVLIGSPVVGVGLKDDVLIAAEAGGVVTLYDMEGGGGVPTSALDVASELAGFEYSVEAGGIGVGARGDIVVLDVVDGEVVVQSRVQVGEPLISVATSGDHAIAGRLDGGWLGLDVAGSGGPVVVGRADGVGLATGLASWESGAAVLSSAVPVIELVGLAVDGSRLEYTTDVKISSPALAMSASETGAQVAAGRRGLLSLVGRLGTLSETGRVVLPGWANDVVADGDVAYVAAGDAGVVVVAIGTGPSAVVSAAVGSLGDVRVVEMVNGALVAGVADGRAHVLDIATGGAPRVVGMIEVDSPVTSLESDGINTLFVGSAAGEVQVYQMDAALRLRHTGTVNMSRAVRGLAYDGGAGVLHAAIGGLGTASIRKRGDGEWFLVGEDRAPAPGLDVLRTDVGRLSAAGAHGVVWLAPDMPGVYLPCCSTTVR